VRLTTAPARSCWGNTAKAACATPMKKQAAPSHIPRSRSRISEKNFIINTLKSSWYYVAFRQKGQKYNRDLPGEINTSNGKLPFVIVNKRKAVQRFRTFQNNFVSLLQGGFNDQVQKVRRDAA
jgi:hypothetical protein